MDDDTEQDTGEVPVAPEEPKTDKRVQLAALSNLGRFPAHELLQRIDDVSIFLTSLFAYLKTFDVQTSIEAGRDLFIGLAKHEIDYMRRSVFKGTGRSIGADAQQAQQKDTAIFFAEAQKMDVNVLQNLMDYWGDNVTKIIAPLRTGYVSASLFYSSGIMHHFFVDSKNEPGSIVGVYDKMLHAGIHDVTISASDLGKLSAHLPWVTFYRAFLPPMLQIRIRPHLQAEQDLEGSIGPDFIKRKRTELINEIVVDLLQVRWNTVSLPASKCNLVFAAIGLVLAARELGIPDVSSSSIRILQISMERMRSNDIAMTEIHLNDDIQASLFYMAGLLLETLSYTEDQLVLKLLHGYLFAQYNFETVGENRDEPAFLAGQSVGRSISWLLENNSGDFDVLQQSALDGASAMATIYQLLVDMLQKVSHSLKTIFDSQGNPQYNADFVSGFLVGLGYALADLMRYQSVPPPLMKDLKSLEISAMEFIQTFSRESSQAKRFKRYRLAALQSSMVFCACALRWSDQDPQTLVTLLASLNHICLDNVSVQPHLDGKILCCFHFNFSHAQIG
jgi:hypothetical protein